MSVFNFTNWLFRNKWWMVYAVRVVTASDLLRDFSSTID